MLSCYKHVWHFSTIYRSSAELEFGSGLFRSLRSLPLLPLLPLPPLLSAPFAPGAEGGAHNHPVPVYAVLIVGLWRVLRPALSLLAVCI